MFTTELQLLRMYSALAAQRLHDARRDERGNLGQIIMIALFAVAAVTIAGILILKMTNWAKSTPDPTTP